MTTPAAEPLAPILSAQFGQLMQAIRVSQDRLDEKLVDFRAEIRHSQEEAAAKALQRSRHEKPYTFRKKGHKEQYRFNSRLAETIAKGQTELASAGTSAAAERAHKTLEKGLELIRERQKLIKITNHSDLSGGESLPNIRRTSSPRIRRMKKDWKRQRRQQKGKPSKGRGPRLCLADHVSLQLTLGGRSAVVWDQARRSPWCRGGQQQCWVSSQRHWGHVSLVLRWGICTIVVLTQLQVQLQWRK